MLKSRSSRMLVECGQQKDVAVVGNAGAAEMRVAEAVDGGIGVVITGTTIPAREPRVRTELDHAERNDRAGERMSVPARADERIDVAREIALSRSLRG